MYKGVLTVLWMYNVAVFIICYDFTLRVYFPVINLTKSSLKLYYETLLNISGVNQGILRFITCYIRRTLFENQPFKLQKVPFSRCVLLSGWKWALFSFVSVLSWLGFPQSWCSCVSLWKYFFFGLITAALTFYLTVTFPSRSNVSINHLFGKLFCNIFPSN